MKKILAFTLAETLIVMGIIGIVSALTLQNLNSSTGEKEKIAKVKKIYQNLDDAFGRAQAIYGPIDTWFINDNTLALQATRFGQRMSEFFKTSKVCGMTANLGCFSNKALKAHNGSAMSLNADQDTSSGSYRVLLSDGTSMGFVLVQNVILVDIDGPNKGSNQYGKDFFVFALDRDNRQIVPNRATNYYSGDTSFAKTGSVATGWIIDYDNMDYLKANTTGKCNNSNVTLNAAANPPVISCK